MFRMPELKRRLNRCTDIMEGYAEEYSIDNDAETGESLLFWRDKVNYLCQKIAEINPGCLACSDTRCYGCPTYNTEY